MVIEALLMMLATAALQKPPGAAVAPASLFALAPAPAYRPEARAVDNWRFESALALEMAPLAAARRAFGLGEAEPARCVKLNNYWCIKSAGWNGEIAADAEGHVAFASAEEGAAVAALLLRRYYVDYGRRSARAIIARWAPAQCGLTVGRPLGGGLLPSFTASPASMARMLPQRVVPMGLAPRGIEHTLRARWLAAHGRGGVNARTARRTLALPLDLLPAPSIMAGVSERRSPPAAPPSPKRPASDADIAALPPPAPPLGIPNCAGDVLRLANYAARVAEGVAASPNDDLLLFTANGQPTDNLAKAMANMAAVEIGPARPREGLIRMAVAQLRRMLEAPAKPAAADARREPPGGKQAGP